MPVPFGDDVSAVDIGKGMIGILKTDMLVGKTDVPPGMTLWQAARKAVVMNISDLASKGVQPLIALCSVGLPRDLTEGDVVQIAKGLDAGAREYGAYVIGGDTNESDDVVVSCSLLGVWKQGEIVRRGGANPGDILVVSGHFGRTAAGLKLLLEGLSAPTPMRKKLLDSVYLPRARVKEGIALARSRVASSSIDSSDGLAWSLHELSLASRVGFCVTDLPIAEEAKVFADLNGLSAEELALYGGEEFELVATVKPGGWVRASDAVREVGGELLKIGYATRVQKIVLRKNGVEEEVKPVGWTHFTRPPR